MGSERQTNRNKDRKSDAQKDYERLENEGRFAGNDADSRAARQEAAENIMDAPQKYRPQPGLDNGFINEETHRDPSKSHTYRVEAQNDRSESPDPDLLDSLEDTDHARNKANEGRS